MAKLVTGDVPVSVGKGNFWVVRSGQRTELHMCQNEFTKKDPKLNGFILCFCFSCKISTNRKVVAFPGNQTGAQTRAQTSTDYAHHPGDTAGAKEKFSINWFGSSSSFLLISSLSNSAVLWAWLSIVWTHFAWLVFFCYSAFCFDSFTFCCLWERLLLLWFALQWRFHMGRDCMWFSVLPWTIYLNALLHERFFIPQLVLWRQWLSLAAWDLWGFGWVLKFPFRTNQRRGEHVNHLINCERSLVYVIDTYSYIICIYIYISRRFA